MSRVTDVSAVLAGMLQAVDQQQRTSGTITPQLLNSLYLIHGQSLINAMDLIDNKKIMKVVSSSGRWVYQVTGSSGTPYICLPHSFFCQCPAFKFSVLKRKDSIICKHVLAARLSTAMGVEEEKSVSDEDMKEILSHLN